MVFLLSKRFFPLPPPTHISKLSEKLVDTVRKLTSLQLQDCLFAAQSLFPLGCHPRRRPRLLLKLQASGEDALTVAERKKVTGHSLF
jgi:hypothetical protein